MKEVRHLKTNKNFDLTKVSRLYTWYLTAKSQQKQNIQKTDFKNPVKKCSNKIFLSPHFSSVFLQDFNI